MNERFSLVKPLFIILFAVVIGILYWRGANEQMVLVNKFMGVSDQSAYMNYARQMVESNYTFTGGRNRMPVYPFLQSLFIDPGMSVGIGNAQGEESFAVPSSKSYGINARFKF